MRILSMAWAMAACLALAACGDDGADQPYQEENIGETVTGSEVNTLANIPEGLALINYRLDPNATRVTGSIMNNGTISFVNVQIAFDLYDSQNRVVATVRDTTSEVQPGDTWQFGITYTPTEAAVRAVPTEIQGIRRPILDGEGNTAYPQNNPEVIPDPFQ